MWNNFTRKGLLPIFLIVLLLGCKKQDQENGEPQFKIFFKPTATTQKKYMCFDQIEGIGFAGKGNIRTCIDSLNDTIYVPLNINANSSLIVFSKGSQKDSLELNYFIKMSDKGYGWVADISRISVKSVTFKSFSINCKNKSTSCADDIESLNIFY